MKLHIVIYVTANALSDKMLFLKIWVKMLMANHIENLLKRNTQKRIVIGIKTPYRKIILFWCGTQCNKVANSWEKRGKT